MASKIDVVTHLINGATVASDAYSNIKEGNGIVKSVAKAGVNFAINDAIMGIVGGTAMLGIAALQIGKIGYDALMENGREKAINTKHNVTGTGHVGGYFKDNANAATMRQRALQAIGGAQAQTRNAFGSEARRRASTISY